MILSADLWPVAATPRPEVGWANDLLQSWQCAWKLSQCGPCQSAKQDHIVFSALERCLTLCNCRVFKHCCSQESQDPRYQRKPPAQQMLGIWVVWVEIGPPCCRVNPLCCPAAPRQQSCNDTSSRTFEMTMSTITLLLARSKLICELGYLGLQNVERQWLVNCKGPLLLAREHPWGPWNRLINGGDVFPLTGMPV